MILGNLGCGCTSGVNEMQTRHIGEFTDHFEGHLGSLGQDDDSTDLDWMSASDPMTSPSAMASAGSGTVDFGAPDLSASGPDSSALQAVSALPSVQDTGSSQSGGLLSSLLTGLGVGAAQAAVTVASGAINTATLQATNAQRMSVGQPPLNANGSVMTQAQMIAAGYSQAQVSTFSSQLALGSNDMLIIAAVGIGAVLLLMSSKRG